MRLGPQVSALDYSRNTWTLAGGKTLEGNNRILHLVVKENPAWERAKTEWKGLLCSLQMAVLHKTSAVETTLKNW